MGFRWLVVLGPGQGVKKRDSGNHIKSQLTREQAQAVTVFQRLVALYGPPVAHQDPHLIKGQAQGVKHV